MEKLYCLFDISSNTLYTTIPGCRPTNDVALLENVRSHVAMVRPANRASVIEILETDSHCNPTQSAREFVRKIRESLT